MLTRTLVASSSNFLAVSSIVSATLGSRLIGNLLYAGLIREAKSLPCLASSSSLSAYATGVAGETTSESSLTGAKKSAISSVNESLTAFLAPSSAKSTASSGLLAISSTKLPATQPIPCSTSPKSTPPVVIRLKNTSGLFQSGSLNVKNLLY